MGLLRKDIIKTKMKEIKESLKLIEENLPEEPEKFAAMGLIKDGIYKRVEFCIQNVLDICAIMNSDLELGIPSSEEDIVENLVREGILSAELGERIKRMKGFRNILVHRYGRIDEEVAFESIKRGLNDFREFMEKIEGTLAEKG